jgi:hypothetical protein
VLDRDDAAGLQCLRVDDGQPYSAGLRHAVGDEAKRLAGKRDRRDAAVEAFDDGGTRPWFS